MPWAYIRKILGPGIHWSRTKEELEIAIKKAEKDGNKDAADHIRIILDLRNLVRDE